MQIKNSKNSNSVDRILKIIELKSMRKSEFYLKSGLSNGFLDKVTNIGSDKIDKILTAFPDINIEWLVRGKGPIFLGPQHGAPIGAATEKEDDNLPVGESVPSPRNLIPLYNDVMSIGGAALAANSNETKAQIEYIDPGDWFPGATSAIRHYGDSMIEYPSGCILALKDVINLITGFVPGQNYVIEYGDDWNRVTKRIQKNKGVFMAYSSNEDTYNDGTLIHQPFELTNIHRAWRILGCVVKTESSTGVIKVRH